MTIASTNLGSETELCLEAALARMGPTTEILDLLRRLNKSVTTDFVAGVGALNGATVASSEVIGVVNKTILTLTNTPVAMVDATVQGGGVKIYDFPAGRILFLGCIASLAPKTTTVIADTINSAVAGVWSLGRAVATADAALTGTEADMLPSTAFTSSATINVAAATVTGALAASAQFDGTATAIDMYLNSCITLATDIDADGTIAWSGTVTFHWINLGDY